jgi:decaprenylphospho-beta-D-ribofuranose 2-oxidase
VTSTHFKLSGWGRTTAPGREIRSEHLESITRDATLSRGLGRSYGDSSLPATTAERIVGTRLADRILGFDEETGTLRAEAGLCLAEMNRLFLPRGYFTPVTPGTKFVTLGGMVASDVHGKNHHVQGTIGRHVKRLLIRVGDGRIVECSREQHSDLFFATLGGMGLTGHVLEVDLQLQRIPSPWIYSESFRIPSLDEFLVALKESGKVWPMTVGWLDTLATGKSLGRGILFCGRWAQPSEAPAELPRTRKALTVPFDFPSFTLNRFTMSVFNSAVYYHHVPKHQRKIVDPNTYFYPLDFVLLWNRIYGRRGVAQHQSVIPDQTASKTIRAMINVLREESASSFLTVIKDCGEQGEGMLSFPRPGMSLALDIPIRDNVQTVIDRLNECVIEGGGRIYLTKDGFTRPEHLRAMDDRVPAFLEVCRRWDPEGNIRSAQSERLFGTRSAP